MQPRNGCDLLGFNMRRLCQDEYTIFDVCVYIYIYIYIYSITAKQIQATLVIHGGCVPVNRRV
jgi:hypothetical protein